jgi:hypothetical protein
MYIKSSSVLIFACSVLVTFSCARKVEYYTDAIQPDLDASTSSIACNEEITTYTFEDASTLCKRTLEPEDGSSATTVDLITVTVTLTDVEGELASGNSVQVELVDCGNTDCTISCGTTGDNGQTNCCIIGANAGDTLSFNLTSPSFDPQLSDSCTVTNNE